MEKRKFVIFGVLASVVALLAIMMFASVTFASDADVKAPEADVTTEVTEQEQAVVEEKEIIVKEEEAQPNATLAITFNSVDIPQGIMCNLFKSGEKKGQKIAISPSYTLNLPSGTTTYKVVKDDPKKNGLSVYINNQPKEEYSLGFYGSIGYKVNYIDPSYIGQELNKNISINVNAEVYEPGGTIISSYSKKIGEDDLIPIGGAKVYYYDKNGNLIKETETDNSEDEDLKGTFKFEGLTSETCEGSIYIKGVDDYSDAFMSVYEDYFEDSLCERFHLFCVPSNLKLDSSEHVKLFKLTAKEWDSELKDYTSDVFYMPRVYIPAMMADILEKVKTLEFNIQNDGTVAVDGYVDTANASFLAMEYLIQPIFEEGYEFGYWAINGKNYGAGKADLGDVSKGIIGAVYVKNGGNTPLNPGGDVTYTAKTYDALPLGVVLALIVVAGASAFVVRRRIKN